MAASETSHTTAVTLTKLSKVVVIATACLLIALVVANMFWIVPVYRSLMAATGAVLSAPAQLAISVSHFGVLIFLIGVVVLGIAGQRERRGATGAFTLAIGTIGMLATLYLGLVCTVYLDYARIASRIH